MSTKENAESKKPTPPPVLGTGADQRRTLRLSEGELAYRAVADWMVLRENDEPIASMFYTAYFAEGVGDRPITFVFNGGPGAASAYLHLGLVGPRRVGFAEDGGVLPPPAQLVDNADTWLRFTDLVCIDPIGTGFSRSHEPREKDAPPKSRFWNVERDLDSMGELIGRLLSKENRWHSKVVLAGESYGGFRVARMARTLQEGHGIGIHSAILISPGIELSSLLSSDYSIEHWLEAFPSLAATAHAQRRAGQERSASAHRAEAEEFAVTEWVQLLAQGTAMPSERRTALCERASKLIGIDTGMLEQCLGRLHREVFCRELLRDQQRFIGRYDGKLSNVDPFPDRPMFDGPDITLGGLEPTFTSGINSLLRGELGVKTDLTYELLNMAANKAWRDEGQEHFMSIAGCSMDALRYGMALNPHLKVLISHGYHDLVTPYSSAERLVRQLKLAPGQASQVKLKHFEGGHMFYAHADSRQGFTNVVRELVG